MSKYNKGRVVSESAGTFVGRKIGTKFPSHAWTNQRRSFSVDVTEREVRPRGEVYRTGYAKPRVRGVEDYKKRIEILVANFKEEIVKAILGRTPLTISDSVHNYQLVDVNEAGSHYAIDHQELFNPKS